MREETEKWGRGNGRKNAQKAQVGELQRAIKADLRRPESGNRKPESPEAIAKRWGGSG